MNPNSDALRDAAVRLADPDPAVREAAVETLARAGAPGAALVASYLDDRDARVRGHAVQAMIRAGAAATSVCTTLLRWGTRDARVLATKVLAEVADRAARPALEEALADGDDLVAAGAAEALGRLGDAGVVPALARAARLRGAWVQHAALGALGALATPASCAELAALLPALGPGPRRAAVDALARAGHAAPTVTARALVDVLPRLNVDGRHAVLAALGELLRRDRCALDARSTSADAVVLEGLGAAAPAVRAVAVRVLAATSREHTAPAAALIAPLAEPGEAAAVRVAALESLAELGWLTPARAAAVVRDAAAPAEVRAAAARQLGVSGALDAPDAEALAALAAADEPPALRVAAVAALLDAEHPDASELAAGLLADDAVADDERAVHALAAAAVGHAAAIRVHATTLLACIAAGARALPS
jgi:hypothetical protein